MNIEALLASMTPEIYERLRQAVETGKWPDGTPLNEEQKASSMQAVMLYQAKIEKSSEHMTVGESGEIDFLERISQVSPASLLLNED